MGVWDLAAQTGSPAAAGHKQQNSSLTSVTVLVQAYMQGLDADPSSGALIDKRTDAETGLSLEQIEAVMTSLYGAGRSALTSGIHALGPAIQPTFVVNVSLKFSQVVHPDKHLWR